MGFGLEPLYYKIHYYIDYQTDSLNLRHDLAIIRTLIAWKLTETSEENMKTFVQ